MGRWLCVALGLLLGLAASGTALAEKRGGTRRQGIKLMANSIYNGWRMDDVWLNR